MALRIQSPTWREALIVVLVAQAAPLVDATGVTDRFRADAANSNRLAATPVRQFESLGDSAGPGWWPLAIVLTIVAVVVGWAVRRTLRRAHPFPQVQGTATETLERIARIIETSRNEIYVFDAETWNFSLVNQVARDNLGYSMDELAQRTPLDLTDALDAESFAAAVAPLLRGEEVVVNFETVNLRKDGSNYPVEVSLQLFGMQTPPVFVGILQDITDRRTAERHLMFHSALLASQSEASPDGILAVSRERKWLNYNQRFLDMWNIPHEIAEAASADTAMEYERKLVANQHEYVAFVDQLNDRPDESASTEIELHDGRFLEVISAPIPSESGPHYGRVWQFRDVTDRKLKDAELARYRHSLETLVEDRTAELVTANEQLRQEAAERRLLEAELKRQADHDRLTGLPNRHYLERQFHQVTSQLERGHRVALLFMDLNGFKYVNDTLGHSAGDELLTQVSVRLQALARSRDTLVRLGGDEFALLVSEASDMTCRRVLDRIKQAFVEPFELDEHPFHMSISIGVSRSTESAADNSFEELVRRADLAMYRSKHRGIEVSYYDAESDRHVQQWSWLERQLRRAIERDEFEVHFQPIVALDTRRIIRAEALIRWRHPERGLVMPNDFLPVAEETGFVVQIDRWVLSNAVAHAAEANFVVAVNVTPRTLLTPGFVQFVESCLVTSGLEASRLHIEVTERALAHPESTQPILEELARLGTHIGVDDFGTGYSSLTYLQHYPLSTLKLDKSFMGSLGEDPKANAIAESVLHLARALHLTVVAEGVETETQLAWLEVHDCDSAQGFLFARPMPLDEFSDLEDVRRFSPLPDPVSGTRQVARLE